MVDNNKMEKVNGKMRRERRGSFQRSEEKETTEDQERKGQE